MSIRIPKRFSLRTFLVMIAVVAAVTYVVLDYERVRKARAGYDYSYALWQIANITVEDLAAASEKLALQEAASPWTSKRAAVDRHIERVDDLVDRIENGLWCFTTPDELARRAEYLKENIRSHKVQKVRF
jgi:hypothetical protein